MRSMHHAVRRLPHHWGGSIPTACRENPTARKPYSSRPAAEKTILNLMGWPTRMKRGSTPMICPNVLDGLRSKVRSASDSSEIGRKKNDNSARHQCRHQLRFRIRHCLARVKSRDERFLERDARAAGIMACGSQEEIRLAHVLGLAALRDTGKKAIARCRIDYRQQDRHLPGTRDRSPCNL